MELCWACFCQCHFKKHLETVRKSCFCTGNQQQTLANRIPTILIKMCEKKHSSNILTEREGGKVIYFTNYFDFQSTAILTAIHDGITSWADKLEIHWYQPHQMDSFMWGTKPTSEPLSNSFNVLHSGILMISKFCFLPKFLHHSKWYKHKDGKMQCCS